MKGLSSRGIALKVDVLQDQKIYCCRHVRAAFSPELLQAGTVKGLSTVHTEGPDSMKLGESISKDRREEIRSAISMA